MKKEKVTVMGAGSWGTALATVLDSNGLETWLWMRDSHQANVLNETRENRRYLPGITLSSGIRFVTDVERALDNTTAVILSVPTQQIRALLTDVQRHISPTALIINAAKGLEKESHLRVSEVVKEVLGKHAFVVVSGPSHAEEVARKLPTTLVTASEVQLQAERVQDLLMNPYLRVYTNPDVVGIELAGALKNVIALGAGIADGIGFGDNARAALITRGIAEMARLGHEMGASLNTFAGLTGIGDLIVTCTSMHSRNRRAGIMIGEGVPLDEALTRVGMVVEGVDTASAAYHLARKYGIEMPIVESIYAVLYQNQDVRSAVMNLMTRQKKHETEEIATYEKRDGDWRGEGS